MLFINIAEPIRKFSDNSIDNDSLFNNKKVKELIGTLNIKFIDLKDEILLRFDLNEIYPPGNARHNNEKGYYEISKVINKYINR